MDRKLTRAIVRPPAPNFSEGITTAGLGPPDYELALEQHEQYCSALEYCGIKVIKLPPDPRFPDATFVEDTAVLTPEVAIITRPGVEPRRGETDGIQEALGEFYTEFRTIEEPGTIDGGDVLQNGKQFLIGLSARTNEEGARQLGRILDRFGYFNTLVNVRRLSGILHLKSVVSVIGDRVSITARDIGGTMMGTGGYVFQALNEEEYAANCIFVNGHVLFPSGFPRLETQLQRHRFSLLTLDVSEFRKMDGGLSCLSLRF